MNGSVNWVDGAQDSLVRPGAAISPANATAAGSPDMARKDPAAANAANGPSMKQEPFFQGNAGDAALVPGFRRSDPGGK